MRKVLLLSIVVLLVGSTWAVASAYDGEKKTGDQKNVVIRIKGDATEADGEDWLYIGSADDGEKKAKEIKVKKKELCTAYLGVYMEELSEKIKRKYDYPKDDGVLIIDVVENSPAEEAGVKEDDIIYIFDGKEVSSAKELSSLVKEKSPGDEVEIEVYRGGDKKKMVVILGEYPYEVSIDVDDFEDYAEEIGDFAGKLGKSFGIWWDEKFRSGGRLGVELTDLDEDLAEYFKVKSDEGVLVLRVREDSPAEAAGVKPGDVIVAFNGKAVSEVDDVIDELSDVEEGTVEFEIVRKGKKQAMKADLEEGEHVIFMPSEKSRRIAIPPKRFEMVDKMELEKELEELKAELKELKKKLKELEKE